MADAIASLKLYSCTLMVLFDSFHHKTNCQNWQQSKNCISGSVIICSLNGVLTDIFALCDLASHFVLPAR